MENSEYSEYSKYSEISKYSENPEKKLNTDIVGVIIEQLEIVDPEAVVLLDKNHRDAYFRKNGIFLQPHEYNNKLRKLEISQNLREYPIKLDIGSSDSFSSESDYVFLNELFSCDDKILLEHIKKKTTYLTGGVLEDLKTFPHIKKLKLYTYPSEELFSFLERTNISIILLHLYNANITVDLINNMDKIEKFDKIIDKVKISYAFSTTLTPKLSLLSTWISKKIRKCSAEYLDLENTISCYPNLKCIYNLKEFVDFPIERFPKLESCTFIINFDMHDELYTILTKLKNQRYKNILSGNLINISEKIYQLLIDKKCYYTVSVQTDREIDNLIEFHNKYGSGNISIYMGIINDVEMQSLFGLYPITITLWNCTDRQIIQFLEKFLDGPEYKYLTIKLSIHHETLEFSDMIRNLTDKIFKEKKLYFDYGQRRISRFFEYAKLRNKY